MMVVVVVVVVVVMVVMVVVMVVVVVLVVVVVVEYVLTYSASERGVSCGCSIQIRHDGDVMIVVAIMMEVVVQKSWNQW
jgi:hypothetical protein